MEGKRALAKAELVDFKWPQKTLGNVMHAIEMISEFDIKNLMCVRILVFSLHEI